MKTSVGVWLDHRQAVIVTVTGKKETLEVIVSKAEKQLQRSGDSPRSGRYESMNVPADDRRQRAFTGQLNLYCDAVLARLGAAESILIFGPGEAKGELKKRLAGKKLEGRIVAFEPADKMTKRQIAAKVRQYFAGQGLAKGRPAADKSQAKAENANG